MDLEKEIKGMTDTVEAIKKNAERSGVDAAAAVQLANEIKSKVDGMVFATPEDLKSFQSEMQKQFDELATIAKKQADKAEGKSFGEVLAEKFDADKATFALKSGKGSYRLEMPEVKAFTLASVGGDAVYTYNVRQALSPAQKINFRDIVPTVNTETGFYITYTETSSTNNIAKQAEGSTKGVNAYGLTAVKIVEQFIAGTIDFSKQAVNSLPFITNTLPRLLQRDFFIKENAAFYASVVAAANTSATTSETDKVKKFVDFAAYQRAANYNTSFAIVSPSDMAALTKSTYSSGYYPGAGSVNWAGSSLQISGVPIIEAAWATAGKVLFLDQDYIERVQVSGLAIELSYENNDNFARNMVTARIECQEEINLMLGASAQYQTL